MYRLSPLRIRGRRTRSRGQSLVELALILPVLLLLLLTALDLGRLLYSQITVTNAAKEGALVASQAGTFQANQPCSDTNTIMCGVLSEASGGFVQIDKARVTVAPALCQKDAMYPASGTPPQVSVTVNAPFKIITPIIGAFVGSNLILQSSADAQCLVAPRVTFPSLPAPTALFSATPSSGPAPLAVTFNASASSAVGATITGYSWSFGASGVTASKNYTVAGTYNVTLTVTDSRGQTGTSTQTITVGSPSCSPVTASFTATNNTNGGHPHRMSFNGAVSPTSTGWTWAWASGALTATGQNADLNFGSAGPQSVTLTATKGTCSYTATQTVTAP